MINIFNEDEIDRYNVYQLYCQVYRVTSAENPQNLGRITSMKISDGEIKELRIASISNIVHKANMSFVQLKHSEAWKNMQFLRLQKNLA